VDKLYLPDCTELDKYQKAYGNALRRQAAKVEGSRFLKAGDKVRIGHIDCSCVFICKAKDLPERDGHHFVNNESMALLFLVNGLVKFFTAGDLSNDANKILVKTLKDLRAHIYKFQWHGDRNAITRALIKAIRPLICYHNYHHKETKGGRQLTRRLAEAIGALVLQNWLHGDIYIDCKGDQITVTCSKGNVRKVFRV
jgi:beta-lactamase superfamily II metal-dependent hydrolase